RLCDLRDLRGLNSPFLLCGPRPRQLRLGFSRVHRQLDAPTDQGNTSESRRRESHPFERTARSSCPHPDVERASMRMHPASAGVASELGHVIDELLRCRLRVLHDSFWIENEPARIRPATCIEGVDTPEATRPREARAIAANVRRDRYSG